MKKLISILLLNMLLFINACNKDDDAYFVRVQNSSSQNFKEVQVANRVYKNVQASKTTSYQSGDVVYNPPVALLITNNNDTVFAGAPYLDALGILPVGKYTLKVLEDTVLPSGYNCLYIKD